MVGFLIFIVTLLLIAGIAGSVVFFRLRKVLREQKNFERGLKMVPLLIHLPPPSEDTEANGRDVRDLLDENISKAQILYNIIASTMKKDFKTRFYGQRHFGFEIVGWKGVVHFYAAVPLSLVDVVKQAVVSAYPAARLEEVAEHNIFNPVGKIGGTIGGELTLKEHFAYPIATFQDLKRDAMQSLLNSLSTLDKEDGVSIQILMRPTDSSWRKTAHGIADKKRKGKDSKKGAEKAFSFGKELLTAVVKPPEEKAGREDKPELSSLDQSILDAIDDKTRHPGYEVLIRIMASSNIAQRSQVLLANVVAAFSLFDAPGKNGFKFSPTKDVESFITAYILRFFPQDKNKTILNAVELATIFHFPDQKNIPTSQLERQQSKQVDGPRNIGQEGLLLGYNIFRGVKKPIRLSDDDRRRHIYTVGQTGVGKSVFLENLALQDMLNGKGFAFVDPHGDTAERLLSMVPRERTEDVIYFCPADMDYPMGLNMFEYNNPDQKDFLIQEAINMLYKLYDPQHQGIIGPRYEHWFRNAALTVMANPNGGTFIDIPKVFTDKQYERELKQYVKDQTVLDFWNKEMAQTSDYHKSEVLGWFVSKFGAFLSNEMMRNIIGQTKSSFDLRDIMDNKKILLVNLSKGRTGELNSKLLGMIFVMKFQAAAMSRANIPEEERKDFCLYVDEFQNFSTDSFATILSEARKYRLNLIVANQFTTQLTEEIRDAVFGNVGTIISFRVGSDADADALSKRFEPTFDRQDVLRIPNYNTICRIIIGGVPTQSFSMATLPPLGNPNKQLASALKQLSAAKFGRPKNKVETEIFARLATKEEPKPALGGSPFGANPAMNRYPQPAAPKPMAGPAGGGSSFLDEWLAKRRTAPAAAGAGPGSTNPPAARQFAANPNPYAAPPPTNPASPQASPSGPEKMPPLKQQGPVVNSAPYNVVSPMNIPTDYGLPSATRPGPTMDSAPPEPQQSPISEPQTSNQPNNAEVAAIAQELKQEFGQKDKSATPASDSGEIHLGGIPGGSGSGVSEDTIYIDKDGNVQTKQEVV